MIKFIKNIFEKVIIKQIDVPFALLLLFVFFLPLNQKASTILILINVASFLIFYKRIDLKYLKKNGLLLLLYFLYVIVYSRDSYDINLSVLERKASLIAFPIIFSIQKINKRRVDILFKVLIASCLIAYSFFLLRAVFYSIDFNLLNINTTVIQNRNAFGQFGNFNILQSNYFLGGIFTYNIQGPLIAVLFSISIAYTLGFKEGFFYKYKYVIAIILSLGVFQIFSLIGLISWLFVIAIKTKLYSKIVLLVSLGFLIFLLIISFTETTFEKKLKPIDSRVIIWETSVKTIKVQPIFGFGYKTAQKELEKNYPKTGDFGAMSQERKIDAHNTYLQITLESGIIGLILLLIIWFNFYKNAHPYKIGIFSITIIFFYSLTESILNIYGGLSLFTFFYCLFMSYNYQNENY